MKNKGRRNPRKAAAGSEGETLQSMALPKGSTQTLATVCRYIFAQRQTAERRRL